MQCILQLPDDFEQWFGKNAGTTHSIPFSWVTKNTVGLISQEFDSLFRQLVDLAKEPRASEATVKLASIVQDLREVLPLSPFEGIVKPDLVLGLDSTRPIFLDTLDTDSIDNQLEARRIFEDGTPRQVGYQEAFQSLARLAHSIDILDPYAATAITDNARSGGWLLGKLLSDATQGKIKIFTKIQEDQHNIFLSQRQKMNELQVALEKVVSSNPAFEGHVYIDVRTHSRKFHKRMIRFRFARGSVATLLDRGLGTFAHDSFQAPEEFLPSSVFTGYLDTVKKATERIGDELHIRN
jgi:hypothetical protein